MLLLIEEQPINISLSLHESNLPRFSLPLLWIRHLLTNALKYDTFDFLHLNSSYGVFLEWI